MAISHPSKLSLLLDYVCVHKKLLFLVLHIKRDFNVITMALSAILMFSFSVNNDGDILLHSWPPMKLLMLIWLFLQHLLFLIIFMLLEEEYGMNFITLVRQIYFSF